MKYGALLRRFDRQNPWVLVYRNIGDPRAWLRGSLRRWFYKKIVIPKVDGIVAVSNVTLNVLKSFYAGPRRMIRIPRGVDALTFVPQRKREEVRRQIGISLEAPLLMFVGSLTSEKRVNMILSAAKTVRKEIPDLHFLIVGDGPLRSALQKQAIREGLGSCAVFLGSQADVASLVNAGDILVLASETEGIPGVVLEAAVLGIPSVAPAVGGVPECIVDNETGILLQTASVESLARAIVELISNRERRIKMGNQARGWVMKNFSMEHITQQYLHFYNELIHENKNRILIQ